MATADKEFKGAAVPGTSNSSISASDSDITSATTLSGWPTGAQDFTMVLGRGTSTEEKVLCSSRSGNQVHMIQRGYDDTVATSHAAGTTMEHCLAAADLDALFNHATNTSLDDHTQYLKKTEAEDTYVSGVDAGRSVSIGGTSTNPVIGVLLAQGGSIVSTSQATTSTTFGDLATAGPEVSIDVENGDALLIGWSALITPSVAAERGSIGFSVSGAYSAPVAASQLLTLGGSTQPQHAQRVAFVNAGGTGTATYKLEYASGAGNSVSFQHRRLWVLNLGQ
jgi:hypothetical protein